jgi:hypothetical protein
LREPRFGLAVLFGAVAGTPGAAYVTGAHQLVHLEGLHRGADRRGGCLRPHQVLAGDHSVRVLAGQAESTRVDLQRAQDWLMSHVRQLMAAAALFAGAYMVISGLVRLLT